MNWRALPVLIAAVVFALDRATKVWIERTVEQWQSIQVIPGLFDIVHAKNPGAAFGIFADSDSPYRTVLLIGISLGVLLFISYLLLRPGRAGFVASKLTTAG
ncbi:MAG TPA: signal peptidase II, partial [Bryobacteraceae bacterium]|nr:signal peptidase II [Bryobacteraceae bacterium]